MLLGCNRDELVIVSRTFPCDLRFAGGLLYIKHIALCEAPYNHAVLLHGVQFQLCSKTQFCKSIVKQSSLHIIYKIWSNRNGLFSHFIRVTQIIFRVALMRDIYQRDIFLCNVWTWYRDEFSILVCIEMWNILERRGMFVFLWHTNRVSKSLKILS